MSLTPSALLLIDMGIDLIFDVASRVQEAKKGILSADEVEEQIKKWQPMVDQITDEIEGL